MHHFGNLMFTEQVTAEQEARGSAEVYKKMLEQPVPDGLGEREGAFIAARDSFYMASVSQTGWPYVQHRGGPRGFLKVLSPTRLGFADYRGNRQYVSTGNLKGDDRVSLFLMDYPQKARLKLLGHAQVTDAAEDPQLADALSCPDQGRVERLFTIDIEAFDWNCPQFITPRYTTEELADALTPYIEEIRELRTQVAMLKANR